MHPHNGTNSMYFLSGNCPILSLSRRPQRLPRQHKKLGQPRVKPAGLGKKYRISVHDVMGACRAARKIGEAQAPGKHHP